MSKLAAEVPSADDLDNVDLTRIARDILAMLAPSAIEKHIDIELKQEAPLPTILGNNTALSILLRNLVDNAIRYSPDNGLVLVNLYPEKNELLLEVHDQGPGIPEELHARVFERFFRILGNKSKGSGLGLAIVKQICTMHHATIHLDAPTHGNGLIVQIRFPLGQTTHE